MSAFLSYEGTTDYIAATPAMLVTYAASGSITAGRGVAWNKSDPAHVYQPPVGTISGSLEVAGVALATVADGDPVPVMVWGYAKSLPTILSTITVGPLLPLVITGSGYWGTSGSGRGMGVAGKTISGSAGYIYAFIDCMTNLGV